VDCDNQHEANDAADLRARWPDCDYDEDGCKNRNDPDPYDPSVGCEQACDCDFKFEEYKDRIIYSAMEYGINIGSLLNYPDNLVTVPIQFDLMDQEFEFLIQNKFDHLEGIIPESLEYLRLGMRMCMLIFVVFNAIVSNLNKLMRF
jgi:hypothetical protein